MHLPAKTRGGGQPRWLNLLVLSLLVVIPILAISPTAKAETNNDSILINEDGTEAAIVGNCASDEIYSTLQPYQSTLKKVTFDGQFEIVGKKLANPDTDEATMFADFYELESIASTDGTKVTIVGEDSTTGAYLDKAFMAGGRSALKSIDGLRSWDVSQVVSASYMLYQHDNLESISALSDWKVDSLTCMKGMFKGCSLLNTLEPLNNWNVSNVTDLSSTFRSCSGIKSLEPLRNWDVSAVTSMYRTFGGDKVSTLEPLKMWNTKSLETLYDTFTECSELRTLDGLEGWNISNVSTLDGMHTTFAGCTNLLNVDALSLWDTSNIVSFFGTFNSCDNLSDISGLSNWNVKSATYSEEAGIECGFAYMFINCTSLTSLDALSQWQTNRVVNNFNSMFKGCSNLVNIDVLASWNITNVGGPNNMFDDMFSGCSAISSMTLSSSFYITSDMALDTTAWWWKMDDTSTTKALKTSSLVALSVSAQTGRWQRTTDDTTDPTEKVTVSATWSSSLSLTYNGTNQQISPTSVKTEDGTELIKGTDYTLSYTKGGTTTKTMIDAGTYTVTVTLSGSYVGNSLTQTVEIVPLNLSGSTFSPTLQLSATTFAYTGGAIEPSALVRLDLGSATAPDGTTYERYSYLTQRTAQQSAGSFALVYANNVKPGQNTATATATGISPNTTGSLQATFSIETQLVNITFDANGGWWAEQGSTSCVLPQFTEGLLVTPDKTPTRDGYTFAGWFDGAGNVAPEHTPLSATTYWAHWTEIPAPEEPSGWEWTDAGWTYVNDDGSMDRNGWKLIDGSWYYFGENGVIYANCWAWIGDAWYGFWAGGQMCTGWVWDSGYQSYFYCGTSGAMVCGVWAFIDGAWYGFWANGTMCTGWIWDSGYVGWFYCYRNGIMARNTWVDGYWLSDSGVCLL